MVVGGGAAGLAAASAARAGGARVTLVSEGPLGGDCTWHGCVPTKSLLEAAAAGLTVDEALAHTRAVVARVARTESETALRGAGTDVVRQRAGLLPDARVRLADGTVLGPSRGVVWATGSRPVGARSLGLDLPTGGTVATTDGWLDAVEAHLGRTRAGRGGPVVVVGGGASGVELAQALARLGLARPHGVVLLEREASLLAPQAGAGAVLAASLAADGVHVVTGADADRVRASAGPGSLLLLAVGREPVLEGLGDDAVLRGPAGVVVDAAMRTGAARVCAAGDVTGLRPSTHVAVATGRVAAATLLGLPATFDARWVPQVVYTDPEVASVGCATGPDGTVGGATGEGLLTRSVRVPLSRNDRAVAAGLPRRRAWTRGGFVQVWVTGAVDPAAPDGPLLGGGRLAGALVVGPSAGELIGEAALVGRLGLSVEQWSGGRVGLGGLSAHHAYPTWSWLWEAAVDRLLGR
ncbi:FAD-dependent oxidoreductase [Aquipuribacter sp. MA13-13]|uniref:FAD-dependent oxidoreductase n=1 Tax=Aquipuribacter sp. MA13-13 TaxID=3440840 RepID=UPI003EE95255